MYEYWKSSIEEAKKAFQDVVAIIFLLEGSTEGDLSRDKFQRQ